MHIAKQQHIKLSLHKTTHIWHIHVHIYGHVCDLRHEGGHVRICVLTWLTETWVMAVTMRHNTEKNIIFFSAISGWFPLFPNPFILRFPANGPQALTLCLTTWHIRHIRLKSWVYVHHACTSTNAKSHQLEIEHRHRMKVCPNISFPSTNPTSPSETWEWKDITFRTYMNLKREQLKEQISQSPLHALFTAEWADTVKTEASATEDYHSTMKAIIQKFAPLRHKQVTIKSKTPWHNGEITVAKRKHTKAHRTCRSTKLAV